MGTLAILGIGAAIALVVYYFLAQAQERSVVRSSLRQLEDYEVENVRDQELLNPLKDRAVTPVVRGLTAVGQRFTPKGYLENVRQKFSSLGSYGDDDVDRFLAIRVITIALIPIVVLLIYKFAPIEGMIRLGVIGCAVLFLVLGPDAMLNRKVADRQWAIRTKLPDMLDLLVISVEAGLGFEQALDRTTAAVPGPLAQEFTRMLGEIRAGASRAESLRALERRCNVPEMRSFVLAILQADTFGVSIGRVLRTQADEMRVKRRQIAQEKAMKAPVKMLVPMVLCIFPSLFIVVLAPAVINIVKSF
ncbi:MAG TPA: type II secretion system F family protein [Acidimicrobiales bacterium]|nr:type II secretion system F family protein [Acidimicrobiales bacterium]